jgi:hypothetical protein
VYICIIEYPRTREAQSQRRPHPSNPSALESAPTPVVVVVVVLKERRKRWWGRRRRRRKEEERNE